MTRIARVTGLDRTGVEVACAVRPGGHVLQVTQGKGLTFGEAAAGALMEGAELACAERVDASELAWASELELCARRFSHIAPADLGGEGSGAERLAWREARDLSSAEPVLAPAAALHVPPQGAPALGLAGVRWTSNGMGAHPAWESALLHALLEAVERDQVARALPEGWTEGEIARRIVARAPRGSPGACSLAESVERGGFDVHLFDLGSEDGVGLPVAGALLFDRQRGPVPLTAGYACRLRRASAFEAALLEAAQSRLTDIHGAREDVSSADAQEVERLRRACNRARRRAAVPGRRKARAGEVPGSPDLVRSGSASLCVGAVLARLARAGHARAVAVDLAPAGLGVHVAKVLIPGLLLSSLL